ncbi:Glycogen synthase, partial [Bienertia sinuspersici]
MDYSLAALKLMCEQLKQAKQTPSQSSFSYGGILFQRAWVQGLLVSVSNSNDVDNGTPFLLDDGTGVVELQLTPDFLNQNHWLTGMYVMVVGSYIVGDSQFPMIK